MASREDPSIGSMIGIDGLTRPQGARPDSGEGAAVPDRLASVVGRRNMLQLIQLRWFAVVGQLATLVVLTQGLGIRLPLPPMLEVVICLIGFNLASWLRYRERSQASQRELFIALLVDVAALTAQLYFTGGTTNPFVSLYLLQVILGTVLLEPRLSWTLAGVMLACLCGLTLFSRALAWPPDPHRGLSSVYVQGMLLSFALNAGLLVLFMSRIQENLRIRDRRLAQLRQQAVEQEQIVRMGLLASGAAHELGTPLATLSVILGDWRRMPQLAGDPGLLEDIAEMDAQLRRCKTIVSGILLSAGEARGEAAQATTLADFLDGLVADWCARRPGAALDYRRELGLELAVVADAALRQMVGNVLDNAHEASPRGVQLDARRTGDWLLITVTDHGPGFAQDMLAQFGTPYQSSKGRPGGGLGLFLVVNVARALGGEATARNPAGGGAEVCLRLPLSAIALSAESDHVE